MITYEDCVALSDLTREEIAAIAEHENIPMLAAAEMGNYLLHRPDGVPALRRMIVDDIVNAEAQGDFRHARELVGVLHRFDISHPA